MDTKCGRAACYRQDGAVLVRPAVLPLLRRVDTLIFDMDGVLVDVTDSIATVDCLAVETYLRLICGWQESEGLVTREDAQAYKLAGGFNDDWDLVKVMALHLLVKAELARSHRPAVLRQASPTVAELMAATRQAGGGYQAAVEVLLGRLDDEQQRRVQRQWHPELVKRVFQELYAGETYCPSFYGFTPQYVHVPGLIHRDRPLLEAEALPPGVRLGIFSGRTEAETWAALELLGLQHRFPRPTLAVAEDGPLKPAPDGLARVLAALDSEVAVYVGDMPDDREAVMRYRKLAGMRAAVIDCLVLTGPLGGQSRQQQLSTGADLVCEDVNQLCRWLGSRRQQ